MAIRIVVRMPMPLSTFVVAPINARTVQYQREADDTFFDVGIDLNEAIGIDMKAKFTA